MISANMKERQKKIIADFEFLKDWLDKYRRIIELGKTLETYPEEYRNEAYKVRGCQSQVWLYAILSRQGQIKFFADSDALIVRGLIALLLELYSNASPDQILSTPPEFIRALGLSQHLTPSRANGLSAMVNQIHNYAIAYKVKKAAADE